MPARPRRGGVVALTVLSGLALIAVAVCGVLVFRTATDGAVSVPNATSSPSATSTPEQPKKSYSEVPDTGGPATGQAEAFSTLMRARGLACSDENLAKVFSRGCYRKDFDHSVRVEFLGPVSGALSDVKIDLNYIGAEDEADAHRAFDDLVGDFVEAAELSAADTAAVREALAGEKAKFSIDWGEAKLHRHSESTSEIRFLRADWKSPDLVAATLPGDLDLVESIAVQRGFHCEQDEYKVECSQGGDDGLKIVANRAIPEGLDRLFVRASADDDTAMDAALAEISAVLDGLGGPRAAEAKAWFTDNRTAAGGHAYAGGLHAFLDVVDEDRWQLHIVQFDLTTPCRYNSENGGFC
jgi:hypothetical protein